MRSRVRLLFRLIRINVVLLRHGLDEVILATHVFRPLRFIKLFMPWSWLRRHRRSRGERIRLALEDLGPIFVKFGQILSTRRDLVPGDIAVELARLQDRVPPFPGEQAKAMVAEAYGESLDQTFSAFDENVLASASIAQVHPATLIDGQEVIVKVVRPGIRRTIEEDLRLLYTLARLTERYWSLGRRLHPVQVVAEFDKTIHDELDLVREASNASQLRRNFEGSELVYVPPIYWPGTRSNVMVMERIHGIQISDVERLKAQGVDLKALAERGVEIFFTQVFRDSFFHADMHPGNVFVDPDPARTERPRYMAIDFGIMGTLDPVDHHYLAENFLAFFNRDYRRVAELHVESGWVPEGTRIDEFEGAIRAVCEPIFERPLREISFGALLLRLFQTGRRFDMEIQPQLVLLQKTLLAVEGLGRDLYPDLDLWSTAKPFMERWMRQRVGLQQFLHSVRHELPRWSEQLPHLPKRVDAALGEASAARKQLEAQRRELTELRQTLRRNGRRQFASTIGAALVISAFLLMGLDGHMPAMVAGAPGLSWLLGGLGGLLWLTSWPGD
jgi:ubiquinone biosynthesis protein